MLRPPLTAEETEIVKTAFEQIEAHACYFDHVPFESREPMIFRSTTVVLAPEGSLDPKPQAAM